ncbi:MAG: OmpA family protein [Nitrospira sp.]
MMSPQVRRRFRTLVLWLTVVMIASGCSGRSIVTSAEDQEFQAGPPPAPVAEETKVLPPTKPEEPEMRVEEEPVVPVTPVQPSSLPVELPAELSDVYFDFDRYAIRADARSTLKRLAGLLTSELTPELVIEGHCDERGTSAYNLVLGERRAQAAKQYLEDHGMTASQIRVTSYGKERPFCTEHSEACWQSNRRVHFRKP